MKNSRTFNVKRFEGKTVVLGLDGVDIEEVDCGQFVIFRTSHLLQDDALQGLLKTLAQIVPKEKKVLVLPSFIDVCRLEEADADTEKSNETPPDHDTPLHPEVGEGH